MKSDGIPVGLLAELRWNFLHIPSRLRLIKPNQESKIWKSISVFIFSAFMHLHWSAKTSSKNCYYEMLLKITLEMSLNIKEMLRFICKRQRHLLHSYFEIWLVALRHKSFCFWWGLEDKYHFELVNACTHAVNITCTDAFIHFIG